MAGSSQGNADSRLIDTISWKVNHTGCRKPGNQGLSDDGPMGSQVDFG